MTIRVINIRNFKLKENEILIKIDRTSPLGNPFYMKNESQRDYVCDKYEEYFYDKLQNIHDPKNKDFIAALKEINILSLRYDIALGCWRYPKRCHVETIMNFLQK